MNWLRGRVHVASQLIDKEPGVVPDAPQERGAARPLPASSQQVEARNGRDAASVHEAALLVLGLRNVDPSGVFVVAGRPDDGIDVQLLAVIERQARATGGAQPRDDGHAVPDEALRSEAAAGNGSAFIRY